MRGRGGDMIAATVVVVVALLSGGCAHLGRLEEMAMGSPELVPPDTSRVVPVHHKNGVGQLCPVTARRAWTAHHVSSRATRLEGRVPVYMVLDIDGEPVTAQQYEHDMRRDLAWVEIEPGYEFEGFYKVSEVIPVEGDPVWIVGYDFHDGLKEEVVQATVLNVRGGMLYYDETPGPGSSGSCILNQAGEVVGINTSMYRAVDGRSLDITGIGELIVGKWAVMWTLE